jgi:predicted GIY-YIG superfamily endonuclease
MSLSLPVDLEAYAEDYDQLTNSAGCYVLELSKPDHPREAWDAEYDHRPSWFDAWATADTTYYVGAAKCVLSRLEDHRDSDVRLTALTRVCSVISLENVHWYNSADKAFLRESRHALELDQQTPESTFVRQA